jgi:hypothetical protein
VLDAGSKEAEIKQFSLELLVSTYLITEGRNFTQEAVMKTGSLISSYSMKLSTVSRTEVNKCTTFI